MYQVCLPLQDCSDHFLQPLCTLPLAKCQSHNRYWENICGMNEWMNEHIIVLPHDCVLVRTTELTTQTESRNSKTAAAKLLQSCPTLCDPTDGSPPGSPVPGIPQARTLEWVAISFSNVWKWKVKVKSLSHVWLLATMDCSLPGSSVHGIFQARVLEWFANAFSKQQNY